MSWAAFEIAVAPPCANAGVAASSKIAIVKRFLFVIICVFRFIVKNN
jgi:hypothetical protein